MLCVYHLCVHRIFYQCYIQIYIHKVYIYEIHVYSFVDINRSGCVCVCVCVSRNSGPQKKKTEKTSSKQGDNIGFFWTPYIATRHAGFVMNVPLNTSKKKHHLEPRKRADMGVPQQNMHQLSSTLLGFQSRLLHLLHDWVQHILDSEYQQNGHTAYP